MNMDNNLQNTTESKQLKEENKQLTLGETYRPWEPVTLPQPVSLESFPYPKLDTPIDSTPSAKASRWKWFDPIRTVLAIIIAFLPVPVRGPSLDSTYVIPPPVEIEYVERNAHIPYTPPEDQSTYPPQQSEERTPSNDESTPHQETPSRIVCTGER
jgi:hypothetical protein